MKKTISLLLLLAISIALFSGITVSAVAETSGTCGDNLTWSFDEGSGTLTISGTGKMENWRYSLEPVPWYANRSAIKTVVIKDGVTSIGGQAFESCSRLESVTIGDGVTSIGDWAFYECTSLTSVTIPDGVTNIGDSAFHYCTSLTSVTILDSVTSIGRHAFAECYALTSVAIPDSVTSIGDGAFSVCERLESVAIGDGVTSIGCYAFSDCTRLTSVTIPDGVTSIGDDAFNRCESLTSVTIGDSVTSIGDWAFYYCSSLTSVTIGDGVTSIGDGAFYLCDSLTDVYYKGSEADRENISIGEYNTPLINATWHYNYEGHIEELVYEDGIISAEISMFAAHEGAVAYLAVYDESGKLCGIGTKEFDAGAESFDMTAPCTLSEGESYTAKLMLWDSDMKPLNRGDEREFEINLNN